MKHLLICLLLFFVVPVVLAGGDDEQVSEKQKLIIKKLRFSKLDIKESTTRSVVFLKVNNMYGRVIDRIAIKATYLCKDGESWKLFTKNYKLDLFERGSKLHKFVTPYDFVKINGGRKSPYDGYVEVLLDKKVIFSKLWKKRGGSPKDWWLKTRFLSEEDQKLVNSLRFKNYFVYENGEYTQICFTVVDRNKQSLAEKEFLMVWYGLCKRKKTKPRYRLIKGAAKFNILSRNFKMRCAQFSRSHPSAGIFKTVGLWGVGEILKYNEGSAKLYNSRLEIYYKGVLIWHTMKYKSKSPNHWWIGVLADKFKGVGSE